MRSAEARRTFILSPTKRSTGCVSVSMACWSKIARPPFALRHRIAARLKIMSRLDISERRLPQDGALKLQLSRTRSIDFRVNSLPTVWGEKVVLRILDPTSAQLGIDQLGFSPEQQAAYEYALKKPQGMICDGTTGSGKTGDGSTPASIS